MKVLWITNLLPALAESFFSKKDQKNTVGGWLVGSAAALCAKGIDLTIASPSKAVNNLSLATLEGISYYAFPIGKGNLIINSEYDAYWREIYEKVKPEVIHIHGTEFSHGLSFIKTCGSKNVVVSIQGLTSVYARYYLSGLKTSDIIRSVTLRDLIRRDTLFHGQLNYEKRGKFEIEMLKLCNHVIGRTIWDYSHTLSINTDIHYHKCNETLRPEFYLANKWEYNKCEPHTVFISQSYYPIKGFHVLLKAIEIVKRQYPDIKVYVAGTNNFTGGVLDRILHKTGYTNYLIKLIHKLKINDCIVFTGPLDANGMINHYLKANVFVSASAIENSPNSLCEAQLLGCPCISSYVGGVSDLIPNVDCGLLYQFDEYEVLAWHLLRVFKNKQFDNSIMINTAEERHNQTLNADTTIDIYKAIIG